jgi:hypothetical protein
MIPATSSMPSTVARSMPQSFGGRTIGVTAKYWRRSILAGLPRRTLCIEPESRCDWRLPRHPAAFATSPRVRSTPWEYRGWRSSLVAARSPLPKRFPLGLPPRYFLAGLHRPAPWRLAGGSDSLPSPHPRSCCFQRFRMRSLARRSERWRQPFANTAHSHRRCRKKPGTIVCVLRRSGRDLGLNRQAACPPGQRAPMRARAWPSSYGRFGISRPRLTAGRARPRSSQAETWRKSSKATSSRAP